MPRKALENRYFDWLIEQVGHTESMKRGARSYRRLFRQLHETIFVAIVPLDENRAADGTDLRYEYLSEAEGEQGDLGWMRSPCSMLELFVVLARHLSFEMDDDVHIWFYHLLTVIGLIPFSDRTYSEQAQRDVQEILDRVIWRTYAPDGRGGLFPLRDPLSDQRKVELWYQMQSYLLEQF